MKRIAAIMTLALVLGIGASAMAASNITTSGRVQMTTDDLLADTVTWDNAYRLQFAGTTSDTSGFQLRFDSNDDMLPAMSRANYWSMTPVGKVVVGKQQEDFSMLDVEYPNDNLRASFTGIGLYPTIAPGVSTFAWYNPSDEQIGAQAKATVSNVTVYGGVSKMDAEDDAKMGIGASVPVIKDELSVYGQYDKQGDVDEKYVGAKFTNSGFTVYGEYQVDAKQLDIDAYKTIGGVELNAKYSMPDQGENTLSFGTTLYF